MGGSWNTGENISEVACFWNFGVNTVDGPEIPYNRDAPL